MADGGKAFIYMNHRLHAKRPNGPVITVQFSDETSRTREGNRVEINGPSVVRYASEGLSFATEHHVRAWVECNADDVVVVR